MNPRSDINSLKNMCIMLTLLTIVSGNLTFHLLTSYACINIAHATSKYTHIFSLYINICIHILTVVYIYIYIHTYSYIFIHTYLNIYISESITTPTLPLPSLDPPSSLAGSETSPISDPMREPVTPRPSCSGDVAVFFLAAMIYFQLCKQVFQSLKKKLCNNTKKSAGRVGNSH